jgi:hypothetical protein
MNVFTTSFRQKVIDHSILVDLIILALILAMLA